MTTREIMKEHQEEDTNTKTTVVTTPLNKVDNSLSVVFNTDPIEEVHPVPALSPKAEVVDSDISEADVDFTKAKENIAELVTQGTDALSYAIDLAKMSDSPRAFEVVATLIKNLADMNAQIVDLHSKRVAMKKQTIPKDQLNSPQKVVNNSIVFQGSTSDLNRMLEQMRKENE